MIRKPRVEPTAIDKARRAPATFKKLLAAGAILSGGIVAIRALSKQEEPPPLAQVQPKLIPTVPVPVVEEEPGVWAMNAHEKDAGRVR
jgi:hypothetical protein